MKESKKRIKEALKKTTDKSDKFEKLVMDLALKKMSGAQKDRFGVYYSKKQKRLLMASKTLEGTYKIAEGTEEIENNAFWGCAFINHIDIPETVKYIGNEAFARCVSLQDLTIPASVEMLGKNPFLGMVSDQLHCLTPEYIIENKLLFTANKQKIIACLTDAAMVIIPKNVVELNDLSFSRRRKLRKIVIPDTVVRIGSDAFSECDALEEVVIPASVQVIEPHAFSECDSLRKVTFLGTVNSLARNTFSNCDLLKKIIVPEGSLPEYLKDLHLPLEFEDIVVENIKHVVKHE